MPDQLSELGASKMLSDDSPSSISSIRSSDAQVTCLSEGPSSTSSVAFTSWPFLKSSPESSAERQPRVVAALPNGVGDAIESAATKVAALGSSVCCFREGLRGALAHSSFFASLVQFAAMCPNCLHLLHFGPLAVFATLSSTDCKRLVTVEIFSDCSSILLPIILPSWPSNAADGLDAEEPSDDWKEDPLTVDPPVSDAGARAELFNDSSPPCAGARMERPITVL
jgi:hypothetical protein